MNSSIAIHDNVVGLIPAGGRASRISPLPCSKELFPIGFYRPKDGADIRPKVASYYLLEKMRLAGIKRAYFILRRGKWDIPSYYGDGSIVDMQIGYLIIDLPYGVPFTLDQAYPFVGQSVIALGFPDILFAGDDVFIKLLQRHQTTGADLSLGLFPASHATSQEDRVRCSQKGEVQEVILRPSESQLAYTWGAAVWSPNFTEFLHEYVIGKKDSMPAGSEVSAGHAIQAGVERGLKVAGLIVSEHSYLDIGTPENLRKGLRCFS